MAMTVGERRLEKGWVGEVDQACMRTEVIRRAAAWSGGADV
jgi:hypothetical protein